jgi:hypothetical protein
MGDFRTEPFNAVAFTVDLTALLLAFVICVLLKSRRAPEGPCGRFGG